uniref:Uncharacterized protein n=1 Tax=Oryza punctata TaxID=4537 RepID=A0A0E0LX24_ORYPU
MRWLRRQVGTHPGPQDVGSSRVSLSGSGYEVVMHQRSAAAHLIGQMRKVIRPFSGACSHSQMQHPGDYK